MQSVKHSLPLAVLALSSTLMLQPPAQAAETTSSPTTATQQLPNFTQLVKKAAPAVVNISTSRKVPAQQMMSDSQLPDIFRQFFGDQLPPGFSFGPGMGQGGGQAGEMQSLGSGFIISQDGYIMTNAHVIDGADTIHVKLNDRRQLKARVIGMDKKTDIALIKIDADHLPVLDTGNSDSLQTGEWVAAIGSPFGFDHSVTSGIVSAINRTLPSDSYVPFIQTDVAINPGNSGGPLLNLQGQVVGVNSQIYTRSGGFMGLSFAVPINVAMDVAQSLKQDGRVHRGYLGAAIQPVTRELADSLGLKSTNGALIAQLTAGAPGEKGGLQPGDVVQRVNGQSIITPDDLPRRIGALKPGTTANLEAVRNGKVIKLAVKVGDWPASDQTGRQQRTTSDSQQRLGVVVSDLDKNDLSQAGVPYGVGVQQVAPDGIAAAAGIQPGDILIDVNRQKATSADKLKRIVADLPKDHPIAIRLARGGQQMFIALRLDGKQTQDNTAP